MYEECTIQNTHFPQISSPVLAFGHMRKAHQHQSSSTELAQSTTKHDHHHHHHYQDLGFSFIIFGLKIISLLNQLLICVLNQPKKKPNKIFLEFKGLSPNEIGEGSDLTVRGIPSRRAPERQRWMFPSHTIISALHLSFSLSLTHAHLHTIPAGRGLCKRKRVLPGNNASPDFLVI